MVRLGLPPTNYVVLSGGSQRAEYMIGNGAGDGPGDEARMILFIECFVSTITGT